MLAPRDGSLGRRLLVRMLAHSLAAVALGAGIASAQAQTWPASPVKIILPYAAGGNSDVIGRIIGQKLSEAFGQQFVIDNRGGASGAIAAEAVAHAAPDGYTLFLTALPQLAILPAMTKTKYDPLKDFVPLSNVAANAFALAVNPSLPVKTAQELVELAKKDPGKLTYSAGGPGSHMNLTMQLFIKQNHISIAPVQFRGGSEMLNALMAGHVPTSFLNASDAVEPSKAGTIRVLGVSSLKRLPKLPDVPTLAEQGFKDFDVATWNGLVAPAGTPQPIVDKIAAAVEKAVKDPMVVDRFTALSLDPIGNTPKEFAAQIATAVKLWGDVVRDAGLEEK